MGKDGHAILNRDRVFVVNSLSELFTWEKIILNEAIHISRIMKESIPRISEIYEEIKW